LFPESIGMSNQLAIKVDVDTDRGTRLGVPRLADLLEEYSVPACFLFSLGPDNTGRAIRRVFRPGFLGKVGRTSVLSMYGFRTLLNGVLIPGPMIGRRNESVIRSIGKRGFEVGIHCHDHVKWQDYIRTMPLGKVEREFRSAQKEFERIFGFRAATAGAPGWQTGQYGRMVYDEEKLLYASDSRGEYPYFPFVDGYVSKTLEIPTTLPTLDELLGRSEFPEEGIVDHYLSLLRGDRLNVLTIHAEIEGMSKEPLFRSLLEKCNGLGVSFVRLEDIAKEILENRFQVPFEAMERGSIDGRSGLVAMQSKMFTKDTQPTSQSIPIFDAAENPSVS